MVLIFTFHFGYSQFVDQFSDGDFTSNPIWSGDTHLFEVIANELNSQSSTSGTYYLSTPSNITHNAEWNFYFNMKFGTSGVNYTDVYLISDVADLTTPNNGYFVRIGGTPDEVSLYKIVEGSEALLIDGPNGAINSSSNNPFDVKVLRDAANNWTLFYDDGATSNLLAIGTIMDNTITVGGYAGIVINQSSAASAVNGHFFDNIVVRSLIEETDDDAPRIDSVRVIDTSNLDVYFNEPVNLSSSQNRMNYSIDNGMGNPIISSRDVIDSSIVHLSFVTEFTNGEHYKLTTHNVVDTLDNTMETSVDSFHYLLIIVPHFEEVLINEIFADPYPQVDLPTEEFVELYNNTDHLFVLQNWKFVNTTTVKVLPNFYLHPNAYVLLCDLNDTALFASYGNVIGLPSFTALTNGGDSLTLMDPNNNVIDLVNYEPSWYQDEVKEDGGWSLERINPNHSCSNSSNWIASTSETGGTPGTQNAVFDNSIDTQLPQIDSLKVISFTQLQVFFSEAMDSSSLINANYTISGLSSISEITLQSNNTEVLLSLSIPIDSLIFYTLRIIGATDCSGNNLMNDSIIFSVGIIDVFGPTIDFLRIVNATTLDVYFNEPVNLLSSQNRMNYSVDNEMGNPIISSRDVIDSSIVHLSFVTEFTNGEHYKLTTHNVVDTLDNTMETSVDSFHYLLIIVPHFEEVLINEIFADPYPQVDLPTEEFVELYNNTDHLFVLQNWKFVNTTTVKVLPNFYLHPNAYVLLCDLNDTALFASYGNVIGLPSFTALTNGGDSLTLMDPNNNVIDLVNYEPSWYQDEVKEDGGWSLERINPNHSCNNATNWIASTNATGGTPGTQNAVFDTTLDTQAPTIVSVKPLSPNQIAIIFNEKMDSFSLANATYSLSGETEVGSFSVSNDFKGGVLNLFTPLVSSIEYTLTIIGVQDCSGNLNHLNTAIFAIPEQGTSGDIVINEVLFNPFPGSTTDFIEIYNNSNKMINLQDWSIANKENDSIANYKVITDQTKLILPEEFILLTKNSQDIENNYYYTVSSAFIQMESLPTFNNDKGDVYLLNNLNTLVDEFHYTEDLHFELLNSDEGVSLERIDYNRPSYDPTNWHSAAESIGFATPGFENSQHLKSSHNGEEIVVSPETFSPDNDGLDDVLTISYHFSREGLVANVLIYDAKGRLVKRLIQNKHLQKVGSFSWDGINDANEIGRVGIYIIFVEIFDVNGNVKSVKKTVVLADRFN